MRHAVVLYLPRADAPWPNLCRYLRVRKKITSSVFVLSFLGYHPLTFVPFRKTGIIDIFGSSNSPSRSKFACVGCVGLRSTCFVLLCKNRLFISLGNFFRRSVWARLWWYPWLAPIVLAHLGYS